MGASLVLAGSNFPRCADHSLSRQRAGGALAQELVGRVPLVYASARNTAIAQNWKIKFNETGKIPAFYNIVPELNHNEMTSFDVQPKTRVLTNKFHFIFIEDAEDDIRVQKRMGIMKDMFHDRKLPVEVVRLVGVNRLHKIFSSLSLADWTCLHTSTLYGTDPENIPMIEDFKRRMA